MSQHWGKCIFTNFSPRELLSLWYQLPGEDIHRMLQLLRSFWALHRPYISRGCLISQPLFFNPPVPSGAEFLSARNCNMVCGQSNYPKAELCSWSKETLSGICRASSPLCPDMWCYPHPSSRTAEGQAKVLNVSAVYT